MKRKTIKLDKIDRHILKELQIKADIPNKQLAEIVGLSPSACLRRVSHLKNNGVIRRIVALIDPAHLDRRLTAIITVRLVRHGPEYRRDFLKHIRHEPTVSQCYMVSGDTSCVLIMHVADMEEYTDLADRLFHEDKNVATFTTHLVMNTIKMETAIALE